LYNLYIIYDICFVVYHSLVCICIICMCVWRKFSSLWKAILLYSQRHPASCCWSSKAEKWLGCSVTSSQGRYELRLSPSIVSLLERRKFIFVFSIKYLSNSYLLKITKWFESVFFSVRRHPLCFYQTIHEALMLDS
jgi:hypothetical protein